MSSRAISSLAFILVLSLALGVQAQPKGGKGKKETADTKDTKDSAETKDTKDAAPAETPPAAGAPAAETAPAAPQSSGAYLVQLKGLEQRVNELKEKIFRSKARLNLLKETVLHGVIAGSRSIIKHKNEMGSSFKLVKLVYAVDGAQIYTKADDSGALDAKKEFEVFNGSIVPGTHTVSAVMVFQGHGYGIFSYLKGYKFTVRSSHTFTAGEGRQTTITVRAFEQGNLTTELKDRPAIKFEVNLFSVGGKGGEK
jgi:hypothetical protein